MTVKERWRFDRREGRMVEVEVGRDGPPPPRKFPYLKRAMKEYRSPVTGKIVNDWDERKRDLRTHDCVDPRDGPDPAEQRASIEKEHSADLLKDVVEAVQQVPEYD